MVATTNQPAVEIIYRPKSYRTVEQSMKKDILIFLPDLFFSLPTYFVMLDAGCTHRLHAWEAETVIGGGCCEQG